MLEIWQTERNPLEVPQVVVQALGSTLALALTLLAAKRVADLHRRVIAHAGHTKRMGGSANTLLPILFGYLFWPQLRNGESKKS